METATLEREATWWHVYVGDCVELGETISVVIEAAQGPSEVHRKTRCHRLCHLAYAGSFDHEPTEAEEAEVIGDDFLVPSTD